MPKNLISQEDQDSLKFMMNDYFVAPVGYGSKQLYDGDPQKDAQSQRGHSRSQVPGYFDSFQFGFDLPASTQLSRMNAKLGRWDRAQEMLSQRQLVLEQKTKRILDRQRKQFTSFEKKRRDIQKEHADMELHKTQKWQEKVQKYKADRHQYYSCVVPEQVQADQERIKAFFDERRISEQQEHQRKKQLFDDYYVAADEAKMREDQRHAADLE